MPVPRPRHRGISIVQRPYDPQSHNPGVQLPRSVANPALSIPVLGGLVWFGFPTWTYGMMPAFPTSVSIRPTGSRRHACLPEWVLPLPCRVRSTQSKSGQPIHQAGQIQTEPRHIQALITCLIPRIRVKPGWLAPYGPWFTQPHSVRPVMLVGRGISVGISGPGCLWSDKDPIKSQRVLRVYLPRQVGR